MEVEKCMHNISFVELSQIIRLEEKVIEHKMCISFSSATVVQSIVHLGKYLLGYACTYIQKHIRKSQPV
jgi:hypothetical protein